MDKCAQVATGDMPTCLTLHPGFEAVALNPWSLQTAYNGYRQQYGEMEHHSLHE
jgi:hypothetical protein